jgi:hypothetical protein
VKFALRLDLFGRSLSFGFIISMVVIDNKAEFDIEKNVR